MAIDVFMHIKRLKVLLPQETESYASLCRSKFRTTTSQMKAMLPAVHHARSARGARARAGRHARRHRRARHHGRRDAGRQRRCAGRVHVPETTDCGRRATEQHPDRCWPFGRAR